GTGALFNGAPGHAYAFYSVATDNAGNVEAPPATPNALTTVSQNNVPPSIAVVPTASLDAGQTLALDVTATDLDPQASLFFTLGPNAPAGAVVDPSSGHLTWPTSSAFGGTTNLIGIIVTDNGQPPLSATGAVSVIVRRIGTPPLIVSQPSNQTNNSGSTV